MATLEKIRNKAGVLVAIFIGFALLAFVLTDLLNSTGSILRSSEQEVAEIDGIAISYPEYQAKIDEQEEFIKLQSRKTSLDQQEMYRIEDQVWNQTVFETIINKKAEELGIKVTPEELLTMVTGKNVHPTIRQIFTNPQTGVFDQAQLINFLKQKDNDPQASFFWNYIEKQIISERINQKYTALLKKGMYITSQQAKMEADANSRKVDFKFIAQRYISIPDSAVQISESEIEDYYNENIKSFEREATRDIEYVTFTVKPSAEDKEMAKEWITKAMEVFGNPDTDPEQYVKMNSDAPYVDKYLSINQINPRLQDFVKTAEIDELYGPYEENNAFKVTRLVDIKMLPDSVKARHILLRTGASIEELNAKADSLINLLNNGADFAKLARANSEDPGSAINGGDLGWFKDGAMVKPFNDACFNAKKGDIVKVQTQFGVHIINIQELGKLVEKYKLATLVRDITYSSKTYQDVYSKATKFAALNNTPEKFNKAVEEENLIKRYGKGIKASDRNIGSLESPRSLVRWAFENEVGAISPIYEFGDEFVIAVLTGKTEKGPAPLESVKNQIKRELMKEKKGDIIINNIKKNMAGVSSIEQLAEKLGVNVQNAEGVTFADRQVTGAGIEPSLVALAVYSKKDELSKPVKGNNGVFLVNVTNETKVEVSPEVEKQQLQQAINYKVDYGIFEALKNSVDITDNRIKFY
ncbi:MAG: peptidylprolyl isomerase [Chlorobi bacterium]|nr:peptidylprolyl isomerase [Chlorobiota bacterium]